jgi:hypothetical protein
MPITWAALCFYDQRDLKNMEFVKPAELCMFKNNTFSADKAITYSYDIQ